MLLRDRYNGNIGKLIIKKKEYIVEFKELHDRLGENLTFITRYKTLEEVSSQWEDVPE